MPAPLPQLSIQAPNFAENPASWDHLLTLVDTADRVGIDRVVVSDHVLYGERLEAYADPSLGGSAGGKQPTSPDGHWLEPLTLLSVLAGRTRSIRLGTAILLAALRTPAVLAKQLATLDVLSGGRLDLGVGIGWQREEYDASGVDFNRRGDVLDHTLDVCQRLWTERVVNLVGEGQVFENIHSMPKPLQAGGVPIWVSGRNRPHTAKRLARFGIGWIPWGDDIADPAPGIAAMRAALEAAGRDPSSLQVQGALPLVRTDGKVDVAATMASAEAVVAAGITDLRAYGRWGTDAAADEDLLGSLAEAFRARFR